MGCFASNDGPEDFFFKRELNTAAECRCCVPNVSKAIKALKSLNFFFYFPGWGFSHKDFSVLPVIKRETIIFAARFQGFS